MLDDPEQLRADNPAKHARERRVHGRVRHRRTTQLTAEDPDPDERRDGQHRAETRHLEAADVEKDWIHEGPELYVGAQYHPSMRITPLLAVVAVSLTGTLIARAPQSAASWPLKIEPITSPSAPDSAQPQLHASPKGVILSWIERNGPEATLKYSERTSSGWSTARTVASGTDWFVNWADVPSVIRLDDGTLVGHWLQKSGPDTYAYDVKLSYSSDNGKTWSAAMKPHTDGTKTEHGFVSMIQMPGAGLGAVWLDGRKMAA